MADPNPIIEAAKRFRAQLISGQNQASNEMLDAWAQTLKTFKARLDATTRDLDLNGATPEQVFEQQRLQKILADVAHEVNRYAAQVEPIVAQRQKEAIDLAQEHSKALAIDSLGPAPEGARATWSTVDPETLEHLVGLTAEGSPFRDELEKVAGAAVERVRNAIVVGTALGRTPVQILSGVQDTVAGHVGKFLTVARTAEMHAYTQSQMDFFQENDDVIKGWRWHSNLSFDTCLACLALHGQEFPLGHPMERHFNCRCMAIPITKTWEELGYGGHQEHGREWQTGEEWLESQPESNRLRTLGQTRFDLMEKGEVALEDFLGHADYPQWGGMFYERSIQDALNTAQKRDILFDQSSIDLPKNGAEARKILGELQAQSAQAFIDFSDKIAEGKSRLRILNNGIDLARAQGDQDKEDELVALRAQRLAEQSQLLLDQRAFLDNHTRTVRERVVFVQNPGQAKVTKITSRFTAERLQRYNGALADFNKMVDDSLIPSSDLILAAKRGTRSGYQWWDNTMKVTSNCDAKVFIHEMGHWLENENPDVQRKAFDFLDRRTAGDKVEKLKDLYPRLRYRRDEITKKDKFKDAYVGKQYLDSQGNRYGSEIVSMGMEQMYANPEKFATEDPDYFDFIYDLLRGL